MSANALVWVGYQTCAWFTPRITNVAPFDSTTRVPSTCRPTAAFGRSAATTAGYHRLSIFWMPVVLLGCTPSVVSAAVSKPGPLVDDGDRRGRRAVRPRPARNGVVQVDHALAAGRAVRRVHRDDLRDDELDRRGCAARIWPSIVRVGAEDGARRDVAPDVVGAQVHQDDVGTRRRQPARQLVVPHDVRRQDPAMAFVLAVVREATARCRQRTDEVDVGVPGVLQVFPEQRAPASR